jgi:hypothetical protein
VYCSVVSCVFVVDRANGLDHTDFGIFESFNMPSVPWNDRPCPPPAPIVNHCFSVGLGPMPACRTYLNPEARGDVIVPMTGTFFTFVGSKS